MKNWISNFLNALLPSAWDHFRSDGAQEPPYNLHYDSTQRDIRCNHASMPAPPRKHGPDVV